MSFFYFKRRQTLVVSLMLAVLFTSCTLFDANADEESLSISLPDWPPQSEETDSPEYPPLSRWKITLAKNCGISVFYASPNEALEITIQKNCPFSIQAQPITLLQNGSECIYFHPAGFIYPSPSQNKASWEQGFAAFLMEGLYKNCSKNGLSQGQAARYVSSFNWQKLISISQEKTNPWLCDSGLIIKNLSEETFRASLLTPSSCYQLSKQKIYEQTGLFVLSPYIPENLKIAESRQITIKKDFPMLLSDVKEFGIFITYLSAKNIHIEYIYIPIYKEEI